MKRILYLLLVLPLLGLISSCNDDKDLPQVSLSIDYTGATIQDGTLYVVQGDTLNITALKAIPDEGTKAATISNATYFIDGVPVFRTGFSPFPIKILASEFEVGKHMLTVDATVLQVDKEIGFAIAEFPFEVVANDAEQPGEGEGGTINPETRVTDSEK